MWDSNPSLLREKLRIMRGSLLIMGCHNSGKVYGEIVSQPLSYLFQCGFFLICLMCRSCSASFGVYFTGNCSIHCYRFVCLWKEVSSGSSCITILNQNPKCFFKKNVITIRYMAWFWILRREKQLKMTLPLLLSFISEESRPNELEKNPIIFSCNFGAEM